MRLFSLLIITFFTSQTFGLSIGGISGKSNTENFTPNSNTPGQIIIYGGLAGDMTTGTCAQATGVSECDNCGDGKLYGKSCNQRRIYDNLRLQISFTSTAAGIPKLYFDAQNENDDTPVDTIENYNLEQAPGAPLTLSILWTDICQLITDPSTSCEAITDYDSVFSGDFKIGVDATGSTTGFEQGSGESGDDFVEFRISIKREIEAAAASNGDTFTDKDCQTPGLCQFSLFPGDEKAYVENVEFGTGTGGLGFARLHMLCSDDPSIKYETPNFSPCATPIIVVNNNSLQADIIEGLTNDVTHYFRSAVEDKAGNIGFYTNPAQDTDAEASGSCPAGTNGLCHEVTPSEVAGLFADKANCFIATAAYGSPMDPHLDILREFRGRVLFKFRWGRDLVRWYYKTSPPWARWISESPTRMFFTRMALTPAFVLAYGILRWQWTVAILGLLIAVYFYRKKQPRKA